MNQSKAIKFLRVSYWAGAIVDTLVLIPMLSPKVAGNVFGIPNFNPGNDFRYGIHIGVSLILGLVALLIWTGRRHGSSAKEFFL